MLFSQYSEFMLVFCFDVCVYQRLLNNIALVRLSFLFRGHGPVENPENNPFRDNGFENVARRRTMLVWSLRENVAFRSVRASAHFLLLKS